MGWIVNGIGRFTGFSEAANAEAFDLLLGECEFPD
jgi:hypothetical protein